MDEITRNDSLQLWKEKAWHDKGTVFLESKTPRQAAEDGGMLWKVEQFPIEITLPDGTKVKDENHVLNVRMDTRHSFGPVGKSYPDHQPEDFISFIESLAESKEDLGLVFSLVGFSVRYPSGLREYC